MLAYKNSELNQQQPRLSGWQIGLVCLWLSLVPLSLRAESSNAAVKAADIELRQGAYELQAELNIPLSTSAKDALMNGIPLCWDITIKLKQQRRLLWDSTLVYQRLRYQLRYYALLNVYRVKAEHNGQISNFSTLNTALNTLAHIQSLKLINKSDLEPEQRYALHINIDFDREALPIPLRSVAYFSEQWSLSSPEFIQALP